MRSVQEMHDYIMHMRRVQGAYDYIVHTLNAAQIVELCAMLLHVEADTLRAWVARCESGQNR